MIVFKEINTKIGLNIFMNFSVTDSAAETITISAEWRERRRRRTPARAAAHTRRASTSTAAGRRAAAATRSWRSTWTSAGWSTDSDSPSSCPFRWANPENANCMGLLSHIYHIQFCLQNIIQTWGYFLF